MRWSSRQPSGGSSDPSRQLVGRLNGGGVIKAGLKTGLSGLTALCVIASLGAAPQPDSTRLAPPRSGLVAVPLPPLDDFEPAVANQMREQLASFREVVESGNVSSARLADAYGSLGRLFHAYEFCRNRPSRPI